MNKKIKLGFPRIGEKTRNTSSKKRLLRHQNLLIPIWMKDCPS
jgi:hypothetical protein